MGLLIDPIPNSLNYITSQELADINLKENYQWDLAIEWVDKKIKK